MPTKTQQFLEQTDERYDPVRRMIENEIAVCEKDNFTPKRKIAQLIGSLVKDRRGNIAKIDVSLAKKALGARLIKALS